MLVFDYINCIEYKCNIFENTFFIFPLQDVQVIFRFILSLENIGKYRNLDKSIITLKILWKIFVLENLKIYPFYLFLKVFPGKMLK